MIAPLSLSSLALVASLFIVLPCRAASTSETNSASARDGASVHQYVSASVTQKPTTAAPTNPPVAGLQAAAAPLLPQSVPLSSIQSLLDLARHSACRDAARLIEDGNISAALAALDTLTAGAFYWRGPVSNGYQQGFFVNALRGYCFERTGDIVKAYRAYQNSRAYFDNQAAAVQCPEPRLEVFLGLGRTCYRLGRIRDAELYIVYGLSCGRTNTSAHAQARVFLAKLMSARGRIKQSLEHFRMLESQAVPLDRDAWHRYAVAAFNAGDPREGVRILLSALSAIGVSDVECNEDSLLSDVRRYWLHFNNADIMDFDLFLGAEMVVQAEKGRERLIAFLINTRNLLACVRSDLLCFADDDLMSLSNQIARGKSTTVAALREKHRLTMALHSPGKGLFIQGECTHSFTNELIEDEVNHLLLADNCHTETVSRWARLRGAFGDAALSAVPIDGVTAAFLYYVAQGQSYLDRASTQVSPPADVLAEMPTAIREANMRHPIFRTDTNAAGHAMLCLQRCLDYATGVQNDDRVASVHLLAVTVHTLFTPCDVRQVLEHFHMAETRTLENRTLMLDIISKRDQLSSLSLPELERVIAENGDNVPRRLREHAAVMLFDTGRNDDGFNAALDCFIRSPLQFTQDGALELLRSQQNYLTLCHVRKLRAMLLSSEMRIAALVANAPLYALLRGIRNEPWLALQEQLAVIEEVASYTDDHVVYLRNHAVPAPSNTWIPTERAARLYMQAQAGRAMKPESLDWQPWTAWVSACDRAPRYLLSMEMLAPRSNVERSRQQALSFYYAHELQIPADQRVVVADGLCMLAKSLNGSAVATIASYEIAQGRTGTALRIAVMHMSGAKRDAAIADVLLAHADELDRDVAHEALKVMSDNAKHHDNGGNWDAKTAALRKIIREKSL